MLMLVVAVAALAVLWMFLFNPGLGLFSHLLNQFGYNWNYAQNSGQALDDMARLLDATLLGARP